MNHKEKAKKLVAKFSSIGLQQREEGIQCALICIDNMIEEAKVWNDSYMGYKRYKDLLKVKTEINKL